MEIFLVMKVTAILLRLVQKLPQFGFLRKSCARQRVSRTGGTTNSAQHSGGDGLDGPGRAAAGRSCVRVRAGRSAVLLCLSEHIP
jgi:hypothetical protein